MMTMVDPLNRYAIFSDGCLNRAARRAATVTRQTTVNSLTERRRMATSIGFRQAEIDAMPALGIAFGDIKGHGAALGQTVCGHPKIRTQFSIVDVKQNAVLPVRSRDSFSKWSPPEAGDTYGHISHGGLISVHHPAEYRVSVLHAVCCMGEGNEARHQYGQDCGDVRKDQASAIHRILLDQENPRNRGNAG